MVQFGEVSFGIPALGFFCSVVAAATALDGDAAGCEVTVLFAATVVGEIPFGFGVD